MGSRFLVARSLTLAVAVGAGVLLAGCGRTECLADGHCVDVPGNFGWGLRWVGFAVALVAALASFVALVSAFGREELGDVVVSVGALLVFGVFAGCVAPSKTSPRERAEQELAARREELGARASARALEERTSPTGQLETARAARQKLEKHLHDHVDPLRKRYATERDGYLARLRKEVPATKAASLAALRDAHVELADTLVRAAVLERAIGWLDAKATSGARTLHTLEQKCWMLEKIVELREVASEDDRVEIAGIVAAADAIVDQKLDPPAKQEIADLEAKLFARAIGGGS